MFALIIGIIVLIGGLIAGSVLKKNEVGGSKVVKIICVIIAILLVILSCFTVVPTGYTGILTTFGRVDGSTVDAGISFIFPWQKVVKMDNRTQKVSIETSAFSSDIQQVDLAMSVNYCIDKETAQDLYKNVGENYYEKIVFPRILENTKAVFSQYTAENLIANRDSLSDMIVESTTKDMNSYGVTIVSIAIEDVDFTDAFTTAVEAKQVAAQNKLTAETEQSRMTMEKEAEAKRAVISANAEADIAVIAANADLEVVKIQAEASLYAGEREAEMNKRISEALTPDLIDYYWIKQWTGILPTTVLAADSNYMLDLTNNKEE